MTSSARDGTRRRRRPPTSWGSHGATSPSSRAGPGSSRPSSTEAPRSTTSTVPAAGRRALRTSAVPALELVTATAGDLPAAPPDLALFPESGPPQTSAYVSEKSGICVGGWGGLFLYTKKYHFLVSYFLRRRGLLSSPPENFVNLFDISRS